MVSETLEAVVAKRVKAPIFLSLMAPVQIRPVWIEITLYALVSTLPFWLYVRLLNTSSECHANREKKITVLNYSE